MQIRTDMALELAENAGEIRGVTNEIFVNNQGMEISRIHVGTYEAAARLGKKKLADFADVTERVVKGYMETLLGDVSWFCKKFDYRYENEPWKNSKDSVERAIKFLRSDLHRSEK